MDLECIILFFEKKCVRDATLALAKTQTAFPSLLKSLLNTL